MTEYSSNQPVKKEWTEKSEARGQKKRQEKGTQTANVHNPTARGPARQSSTGLELDTKYV